MSMKTPDEILKDAAEKHNIDVTTEAGILSLIAYAIHIGYNAGWMDCSKEYKQDVLLRCPVCNDSHVPNSKKFGICKNIASAGSLEMQLQFNEYADKLIRLWSKS